MRGCVGGKERGGGEITLFPVAAKVWERNGFVYFPLKKGKKGP